MYCTESLDARFLCVSWASCWCAAVCRRSERSRPVPSPAVQRLDRKCHIRRRSSRDGRKEREQERVRPVDGTEQAAAILVARSCLRQQHQRLRHSSVGSQGTFCGYDILFFSTATHYESIWRRVISMASSIPQHADFHAAPRNSPFASEFAACRGKCGIARFCYIYI